MAAEAASIPASRAKLVLRGAALQVWVEGIGFSVEGSVFRVLGFGDRV